MRLRDEQCRFYLPSTCRKEHEVKLMEFGRYAPFLCML